MTRSSIHRSPSLLMHAGRGRRPLWLVAATVTAGALTSLAVGTSPAGASPTAGESGGYTPINLVSNVAGAAQLTDPNLVNAWGLAASAGTDQAPGSPLWVSDNGSDKSTVYSSGTATSVTKSGITVNVTSGAPTGMVSNTDRTGFLIHDANGHMASPNFIFDSENGSIDAWSSAVGGTGTGASMVTEQPVTNGANAVYKGLAMAQASDGKTYLYAANFRSGRVEVYDDSFKPVQLPGGLFVDPRLPAGYAPFNIAEIAGKLYVTYAKQDSTLHDDMAGQGHGFVDVFSNDGALIRRLVTHGQLNSPWGLALAPAGFGHFGGALLVGNFGDGHINAYNPDTGSDLGQLQDVHGRPIAIDGLWGLMFGNGNAAKTNELVFSAGPNDEANGLLGKIVASG